MNKQSEKEKIIKVFISQPMTGFSSEQIKSQRDTAMKLLNASVELYDESTVFEIVNPLESYKEENISARRPGLYYLGKDLDMMKDANIVLLCEGWEKSTGCKLEIHAAVSYFIPILAIKTEVSFIENTKCFISIYNFKCNIDIKEDKE